MNYRSTLSHQTRNAEHDRTNVLSRFALRTLRLSVLAILASGLSGCFHLEPWVKPYERAALADPIMMPARDAVADEYMQHVHEVREGARGASGSAGGGCGCN
jgi:Domain of unknown function (DUF4266)